MGKSSNTVKRVAIYLVGSAALCAVAFAVIPKAISYVSGAINKNLAKVSNARKSDDDWGPVIEKKHPDARS